MGKQADNPAATSELLTSLREKYDAALAHYTSEQNRIRILDLVDDGQLWAALGSKMPTYQILPDTNFITYVKSNLVASLYTVARSAEIMPTSDTDKDICMYLNLALDNLWQQQRVGDLQYKAGEWAALVNLGITQVGWDDTLTGGSDSSYFKGCVSFKNIDPMKFMRDPFAADLHTAAYCMTYDVYHKSVLLANPNYREQMKAYLADANGLSTISLPSLANQKNAQAAKDYYTLVIMWVRNDDGTISEYHTLNLEVLLYKKDEIKPAEFPFAMLYCNDPRGSKVIGTSECAKIFANNVAYNLLDSIMLTAEYKNQCPPKFVSTQSGLNINAFAQKADDPGYVFPVEGDASKAVHYQAYPMVSPSAQSMQQRTQYSIQLVSGVDGRYTGRESGSVITTGGIESMLNRTTTIDTPKIVNYERYTSELSKLALANMILYSQKRNYFRKSETEKNKWEVISVDFPNIPDNSVFNYQVNISADLPKNKQRIAAMSANLMEKQLQYGRQQDVQFITPEEFLEMQDIPNKERFLDRMGIERQTNMVEFVSTALFNFAENTKNGMPADDAILATAKTMRDSQAGTLDLGEQAMPPGTEAAEAAM